MPNPLNVDEFEDSDKQVSKTRRQSILVPIERTYDGVRREDIPMSGRTTHADDPLD
jgi:hypothetical protein